MPVLSHIHQLFNAEQCQAYIRMLRWQDRPLQCPRCQSRHWTVGHTNIAPGANATGAITASAPSTTSPRPYCIGARDRCHTGFSPPFCCALPVRRGASRENWVSMSARAIAGAGGCAMPLCPMRCIASWKALLKPMTSTRRATRDKPSTEEKAPGARARGRRKKREPGRGHDDKDRPAIIAWSVVRVCGHPRDQRFHREDGAEGGELAAQAGSRFYTDSASSYRAVKGYVHAFVNHTKKEYAREDVHENRAECLFPYSPYLRVFRGVSKGNLPGYIGFFQFLRNFRQYNACEQAELILRAALDPTIARRARKGELVTCFDHFDLLQTAIN